MSNQKLFQPEVDKIKKDANVVVAFHGLMCFAHKQTALVPFCEVGIHNDAPKHSLTITVWEVDPAFDPPKKYIISESNELAFFEGSQIGNGSDFIVSLNVSNPQTDGVKYFQPGAVPVSLNDFRRMPDFESADFYDARIDEKLLEKFGPRVHVQSGIFYAWYLTNKKFKRRDNVKKLGRIAHVMAANIYLNDGESAVLQVGNEAPVPMPYSTDKKYLILIDNGCPTCTDIDFPEYYKTFRPPQGKPEYHLELDESLASLQSREGEEKVKVADSSKETFKKFLKERKHEFSNDDSPCGAASFGRSDGIS
jgi:hypothetical protein